MSSRDNDYWQLVCQREDLSREIGEIKTVRGCLRDIQGLPREERRNAMSYANQLLRERKRRLRQIKKVERCF